MAKEPVTWSEGNRLVAQLGREDYLAARITRERKRRGWSQERLATELSQIGCHLGQSSLSKIENPASGGRRDITIDEGIAFARLFDIPLGELVMPDDTLKHLRIARDLAEGPAALIAADEARAAYDELAERLADLYRSDEQWRATLDAELVRSVEAANATPESPAATIARMQFIEDVVVKRQPKKRGKR